MFLPPAASRAASGGPDAHGYSWADSNSGTPFEWIDISATGSAVLSGNTASAGNIEFDVPWGGIYGKPVSQIRVSRNGYITDALTASGDDDSNDCPLPVALPPADNGWRLYPLHDDLELDGRSGQILYQYFPESPHRLHGCGVHVITWRNVHHSGSSALFSFQALLFDNLDILFQYGAGNPEQGLGSTTGMQNKGATIGLNIYCNAIESIRPNFAILIQPPEIVVNTVVDQFDSPAGSSYSLREAIRDIADGGRIVFPFGFQGYTCTLGSEIALSGKSIALDASMLVDRFRISGDKLVRHFDLDSNSWLSLNNIYLEKAAGGSIVLSGSSGLVACDCAWVANTETTGTGAAVSLLSGSCGAGFHRCEFLSNVAQLSGGALFASAGAKLRMEECLLWRNRTTFGNGGAISLADTTATLRFCDIGMNVANRGGGLHVGPDVDVDLLGCTFDDNRAIDGGGIALRRVSGSASSAVSLRYCTLFGNCAGGDGGGIWESGFGAALDLGLQNCTVFKNTAGDEGGAFYLTSAAIDADAGAMVMADNGDDQLAGAGTLDPAAGDNLETGSEGGFGAAGGESDIDDIGLTDLGHFGGFVRVCMPLQHFPGIDNAPSATASSVDARSFPTSRDGGAAGGSAPDCGAVELGPTVWVTNGDPSGPGSFQAAMDTVESGGVVSFQGSAADLIELEPSGFFVPSSTTVFVDASPLGRVHIHNFETGLFSGQDLALHAIDATGAPEITRAIETLGDFTAHRCSFVGYTPRSPTGPITQMLLRLRGSSSIIRTQFYDIAFSGSSILVSSIGPTVVARDSLWFENRKAGAPSPQSLSAIANIVCVQRCSFVDNTCEEQGAKSALEVIPSRSIRDRAWLFCESTTFSNGGDLTVGSSNTVHAGGTYAEISHNTITKNVATNSFRGALDLRATSSSFLEASLTGNIIADNATNVYATSSSKLSATSGGANLSDDAPAFFTAADISNTDPLLGPSVLGRHGTLVHVLRPGSPCIDAGPSLLRPDFGSNDGRGFVRSFDGDGDGNAQIDIGAVESGRVLMVTTAIDEDDFSPTLGQGNGDSLRECVKAGNDLGGANIGFAPALHNNTISVDTGGSMHIRGSIDIDGDGKGVTIVRTGLSALLFGLDDGVATVTGLTLDTQKTAWSQDASVISLSHCTTDGQLYAFDEGHLSSFDCLFTGGTNTFGLVRVQGRVRLSFAIPGSTTTAEFRFMPMAAKGGST